MSFPHLLTNVSAYAFQVALLLVVGLSLPPLLGLRHPGIRLRYWQLLLATALLLPLLQPWRAPLAGHGPLAIAGLTVEVGPIPAGGDFEPFFPGWWLPAAIGLVSLLRLGWLLLGFRTLRGYRRRGLPLRPVPEVILGVARQLGTRAEILVSDEVSTPLTFGWRRPVVLLPKAFQDLSPAEQRGIACHELLHVRRSDWRSALGEEVLRSLLWFHPAVWILLGRIALCREQVVDLEVVRLTEEKNSYLGALWAVARLRNGNAAMSGVAFLHRGHLFHRVALITKEVSMTRSRIFTTVTSLVGLLALTLMLGANVFPLMAAPAAGESSDEPLRVEGDVTKPIKISAPQPVYPEAARKDRVMGVVIVETVINAQGDIERTKVLKSLRDDIDEAAVEAIRRWKFEPATLDGEPVAVYYNLTINFRLKKDKVEE